MVSVLPDRVEHNANGGRSAADSGGETGGERGHLDRRALLRRCGAVLGAPLVASLGGRAQSAPVDAFDPAVHGFGFRNWSSRTQYFESPTDPNRAAVRNLIRTGWRDQARSILGFDTAGRHPGGPPRG